GRPASCSGWAAARGGRALRRRLSCRRDHMLDGQARVLAKALDEVAAEPAAPLAGERRDDDLVHALVLDDMLRGRVRVGMRDLAVRVDPFRAELAERPAQTPVGVRVLLLVALGRDDQEARGPLAGAAPD